MQLLAFVLLSLFLRVRCGSLAKSELTESQADLGQQRSARVHRIAEDELPGNENARAKNAMNEETVEEISSPGSQKLDKFLLDLPNFVEVMQSQAELFKVFKCVLKELSREGTIAMKYVDPVNNEMTDATASSVSIKLASKNINGLRNLLNSPEELNIHYLDGQNGEKQLSEGYEDSLKSFLASQIETSNDPELKTVKNIAQYLDNILMEAQNLIIHIRNVFESLCRKHHSHSNSSPLPEVNNPGNIASTDQPKKVSIL
ncbi:uncharacterized protein LOC128873984 isoform X2 [Hylaeus volcanicus]|uniref:uncharacterized protein LOC128873984 isoform X2 n=1 Tax=Hylaeus volcanicus TaxID=313075 RepID=UPI0023B86E22|nr:uncharacterized protein LOC128873984 isoform X2 [Hylaeus volcanicus]